MGVPIRMSGGSGPAYGRELAPMKSSPGHDACCGPTDLSRCCRPEFKFHALRHTYASLCVVAGISPLHIARFMGHARVTTTLAI
jgi:integrase